MRRPPALHQLRHGQCTLRPLHCPRTPPWRHRLLLPHPLQLSQLPLSQPRPHPWPPTQQLHQPRPNLLLHRRTPRPSATHRTHPLLQLLRPRQLNLRLSHLLTSQLRLWPQIRKRPLKPSAMLLHLVPQLRLLLLRTRTLLLDPAAPLQRALPQLSATLLKPAAQAQQLAATSPSSTRPRLPWSPPLSQRSPPYLLLRTLQRSSTTPRAALRLPRRLRQRPTASSTHQIPPQHPALQPPSPLLACSHSPARQMAPICTALRL